MRHKKHHQGLGLKKEHRIALLANLGSSLVKHGRVKTTLTKAKALRPFIEPIISLAKKGTLHHRRLAMSRLRDEDAVTLLFNEKVTMFAKRNGGFTRIYKLSNQRLGDAAEMALVEFVSAEDPGYKKAKAKKPGKKAGPKKGKKAAAGSAAEAPAAEAPAAETPAPETKE
ncbi:MAG TPA: 50S ribosomal protein L17 [Opitutaceae bacterium]|nr:50S ribosomal protein L17 [Opitutaceae bacterium]